MAESRGINIKLADDTSLIFACLLLDNVGDKVVTGDTSVRLWHIVPTSGALEGYDYNDNTFKTTALTTASAAATHCTVNNGTYNTGIWTYRHATLTAFEDGHQYIVEFAHADASPPAIPRWWQYGGILDPINIVYLVGGTPTGSECGMTFAELKGKLDLALRKRKIVGTDEELRLWIWGAHAAVDACLRWTRAKVSQTSTANTASYPVAQAIREIRRVLYDDKMLTEIAMDEYLKKFENDSTSGEPKHWAWWGDSLFLHPTPDTSDLDIDTWAFTEPPMMTEDDDKPGVPCEYHELIVDYGLVLAYRDYGAEKEAAAYRIIFERAVNTISVSAISERTGPDKVVAKGA